MNNEAIDKIKSIIEKIRPYIISDGGNIEYIDFKDGTVFVRLTGACENCSMADITIKDGIEEILINEVPEVERVEKV